MENIQEHIDFLSSLPTRVVGTSGFYRAAEYVANEFSDYGLELGPDGFFHVYPYTTTVENFAELSAAEIHGGSIRLLTVWPNLVLTSQTPPGGIEGDLLYIEGTGKIEDLDGKEIAGKIVVMSYDSGSEWLNVAKLGAKAVIFLPSDGSFTQDSTSKFATAPLYFPRYYAADNTSTVRELARSGTNARITCNMHWEVVNGLNVLGVVEGSDPKLKDQIIVLSAHFDSWTPIPELAPGAQESCGISVLLELARIIAASAAEGHGPKRTIWFVALSGQWQALAGARNFVMDYLFNGRAGGDWPYTSPSQYKVYAWLGLDLSTGSDQLGYLFFSYFYRPTSLEGLFSGRVEALIQLLKANQESNLRSILDAMGQISPQYSDYDPLFGDDDLTKNTPTGLMYGFSFKAGGSSYIPYRDYLESEPAMVAGKPAMTLRTIYDYRVKQWTVEDTAETVSLANLKPQALLALGTVWTMLNVPSLNIDYDSKARPAVDEATPGPVYSGPGMSAVRGNLQTYDTFTDRFKDYWSNDTALVVVTNQEWDSRSYIVTATDKKGEFLVKGLGSPSLYLGYLGAVGPHYDFSAFVIDNSTGQANMVSMGGSHTAGVFITGGTALTGIPSLYYRGERMKLPVYQLATVVVFDAFSPYVLSPAYVDPVTGDPSNDPVAGAVSVAMPYATRYYPQLTSVSPPINIITAAESEFHSRWECRSLDIWVEYVTPNVKIGLMMTSTQVGLKLGLLVNSSESNLMGTGFVLDQGQEIRLSALETASDFFNVNEARIKELGSFGILDPNVINLHRSDKELLTQAIEALNDEQYSKAYSLLYSVWTGETGVYSQLLSTVYDVASVTVFFAALLLPFAYVLEEVFYGKGGTKSVGAIVLIFCATYVVFSVLHPGFSIASSPVTIVLGFVMVTLMLPLLAIFFGEASTAVSELRKRLKGSHEEEVARISQTVSAFSVGIGNLRKRTFRTSLTAITLIIFIASLTSLTSITTLKITEYRDIYGEAGIAQPLAPYTGIQIKQLGFGPLSAELVDTVSTLIGHGAIVDYQVWYYPNFFSSVSGERSLELTYPNGTLCCRFKALLGLTQGLPKLYGMDSFLEGGLAADSSETASSVPRVIPVVIPMTAAKKLGLELNDRFNSTGLSFVVTGLIDDERMDKAQNIVDLDQDAPTPLDLSMLTAGIGQPGGRAPTTLMKLHWSDIMILPASIAMSLGGEVRQISVTFPNESDFDAVISGGLEESARRLIDVHNLEIVEGRAGQPVSLVSRRNQTVISGLSFLMIPLLIVIFAVFNTFLASVYERVKEIRIFSAIGLSPRNVAEMFIAEALTFGVLSSVIGYVVGIGLVKFLPLLPGFLPRGFVPNYSTAVIVVVLGLSMLAILISSIYPALKASTLVTPSFERRWSVPTKPVGSIWEIPMPFSADNADEALAVLRFVKEYLDANAVERAGIMFASKSTELRRLNENEWLLRGTTRLAPFETGLAQVADLRAAPDKEGKITFVLRLEHQSGQLARWVSSAREYAGLIRRQLLLWRGLVPSERAKYLEESLGKSESK